jgi:hypothetical protein
MANSEGMAKPGIDNGWVFTGLKAIGKEHKDLAAILNVHASQITRLKKNDRELGYEEGNAIKRWFLDFNYIPPQNGHGLTKDSSESIHTSGQVAKEAGVAKEGPPMSDSELLRFMRTLIQDNQDLRDKVRQLENQPTPTHKGKRRRP